MKKKTPEIIHDLPGLEILPNREFAVNLLRKFEYGVLTLMAQYGPTATWPGGLTHPYACKLCSFQPTCEWWR